MDVPPSLSTGERIRHMREKRGMSRTVLAGLVGYSADWLKKIEAGQRGVSVPALIRLAHVLRVDDLSLLIDGDTPIPVSTWDAPHHPSVAAVREIVEVTSLRPASRDAADFDVPALLARVRQAWIAWHTLPGNRTAVAGVLPGLISEIEDAAIVLDGVERRTAQAGLASAYGLAQHLAVDLVEPEVSRVIADRAVRAAQAADEPVSLAFAAWTYGHVLRGTDADAAFRIVDGAANDVRARVEGDDDVAGLYGSLCLHMAISAAYQGQDGTAWRYWDTAESVAHALPGGYAHPQTVFGQANVALHGVSVAAELRRYGEAVRRAEPIKPEDIPSRERQGRLFGEIAAGHLQRRDLEQAHHFLFRAWTTSPEGTPFSPLTRGVTVELIRRSTGTLKAKAVKLAEDMGVFPAA
ncbi:helix-turn-helix transcriptional regulator [Sphaerisporangium sp. NPDC051017]|uniref:helix-turn-helix domain-containing protein n=1 Tax=Sphaerisporangium sp. NPDC051017 TaxID=3154636 RepID=UPI003430E994